MNTIYCFKKSNQLRISLNRDYFLVFPTWNYPSKSVHEFNSKLRKTGHIATLPLEKCKTVNFGIIPQKKQE